MEKAELNVEIVESCLVRPCVATPTHTLSLSNLDNQPLSRTTFNTLLVYEKGLPHLAKTIREALSKVLVYYYPVAGRLREKEDGKLELECTGEGVLFVEAKVHNTLSILGDLEVISPSFKNLHFSYSSTTPSEDVHPLVLQVNCFTCGGLVVSVTFSHTVFDGKGIGQFLKGLGEIARGHAKPSIEPVWDRELYLPKAVSILDQDLKSNEEKIESTSHTRIVPLHKEANQTSCILSFDTLKYVKDGIMSEWLDICTTFEIVAALVWRARTKVLEIPLSQMVTFFFAIDVRTLFDPPIPNGYYGNIVIPTCVQASAHDIINQPFSYLVNIIKETKISVTNKYLKSRLDTEQFPLDMFTKQASIGMSDWRWLGLNEVDFGLGHPLNMCPLHWNENGFEVSSSFIFLQSPRNKNYGFKLISWMPLEEFNLFQIEMKTIIDKYVINRSKIECNG